MAIKEDRNFSIEIALVGENDRPISLVYSSLNTLADLHPEARSFNKHKTKYFLPTKQYSLSQIDLPKIFFFFYIPLILTILLDMRTINLLGKCPLALSSFECNS